MAKDYHIIHKRSKTSGNKPSADKLDYGEIAVNYASNNEKLFVKNSSGEIATFLSENLVNSAVTSAVTNEATERQSGDTILDTKITNEATQRESADETLTLNYTNLNNRVELIIGELEKHGWWPPQP